MWLRDLATITMVQQQLNERKQYPNISNSSIVTKLELMEWVWARLIKSPVESNVIRARMFPNRFWLSANYQNHWLGNTKNCLIHVGFGGKCLMRKINIYAGRVVFHVVWYMLLSDSFRHRITYLTHQSNCRGLSGKLSLALKCWP